MQKLGPGNDPKLIPEFLNMPPAQNQDAFYAANHNLN